MNGFGFLYAREAKRAGVKSRIVHSHSSDVGEGTKILKRAASELGTLLWSKYSTKNVACSLPAGKYLFGNQKFQIVNNGIDIDRFKFSEESRNKIRSQLGLNNTDTLLGYIGRIVSSKNPLLQVQIFAEYNKLDPSSHYLMLGQGEAMEEAKTFAKKLNVEDKIIFHEYVDNPAPFYSALDAFVMPSANEGLGLVRIEAQASGLPIVESDNLPKEGCVTDLVHFCSLDDSSSVWAQKVFSVLHADCYSAREFYYKQVSEAGFSNEHLNNSVIRFLTDATEIKCES
jgi:glycosyltransferase involved in cell wall biosynthesis